MIEDAVDHVVVVAVGPEFQAVYDRLPDRKWMVDEMNRQHREVLGRWNGKMVQLLLCGLGPVTFARNFSGTVIRSPRVSLIGVCGALRGGLTRGDILQAQHVIEEKTGAVVLAGAEVASSAVEQGFPERAEGVVVGSYLCVDSVAETADEKARLGARWKCDAVDMESYPFLKRCSQLGLRAQVLKAISDDVSQSLPPLNQARLSSGDYDLTAMGKVWKMWTSEQTRQARENLFLSLGKLLSLFEESHLGQDTGREWSC
ncbi:MAG: hypothetical protein K2X47_17790, partial [Bdellovibrionales bacterium]|nr:hypothetical protein [Bdellovibrionales bacterium]